MNLLQLLMGTLTTDDSLKQVEKKSGVKTDKVVRILMIALPLLISYMTKNASKKEGAQSLLGALGQHTSSQTVSQQLKNADEVDGDKIISHILGKDKKSILSTLAEQSGLSAKQVGTLLSLIAPVLLNSLSTATTAQAAKPKPQTGSVDLSDGIDLTDIAALLGGGNVTNTYSNPAAGLLGSLLGSNTSSKPAQGNDTAALLNALLGSKPAQSKTDGSELLGLLTSLLK
ncbi:MAG: DUF937 domain-containing protein [Erysipelotrichaceae bacterium]|nr:DUF937 domain-containing protein [Erysipelotrichaceae bacterium]